MNQFIQLPSGLRVNTARIFGYREIDKRGKTMVLVDWEDGYGNKSLTEDLTAEQLDDLLHGPAIVDTVINLDKLKPGASCQFTYEGQVKHGVIQEIEYSDVSGEPYILIHSRGDSYTIWPKDGTIDR